MLNLHFSLDRKAHDRKPIILYLPIAAVLPLEEKSFLKISENVMSRHRFKTGLMSCSAGQSVGK